ncbi:hybrid sensor histidine kinase/response regulator [Halochromatium salexigens]|uniref:histidine kinase n=1 Tax=Halochromatium salexigens TaxID=49447 RepID=A0AAJ0UHL6_HALSE|nr:ATP-binding protein [Halochromatium salexigens]MBK5931614.1 hybrid sensor histidine kinase/response regulator [Halochromatium salexigens]
MKLRYYILLLLLGFGLVPLIVAVLINLPLVLDRTAMFYQKAYMQNLRADFRDLDQHLASRHEMIRLLAKLPEPGIILGKAGDEETIDLARARYTGWINQMLSDQADLIEILFIDGDGNERFWLTRDAKTQEWRPTEHPPDPPNRGFTSAGLKLKPGEVIVSRIRVNSFAAREDPRQLMTLQLASPVSQRAKGEHKPLGLLLMTIDVGGLANFYRDTLWVTDDGRYLRPGEPFSEEALAFADFPGLEAIFEEGKLALYKGDYGPPLLWVPMFLTENARPLWVARPVDPSPIASFRNALVGRVLSIVLVLILVVLIIARWLASRAERFGQELTSGVRGILREEHRQRFCWRGPSEVRELGEQLNALARSHAEHLSAERQHMRQLEQSNQYKSEFLANVSHELRTPLNSILLLSKLLAAEESGLDDDQRRQARVINEAGRDLLTMIDNVLDISRIEAGAVTVHLEWVPIRPMIDELVGMLGPIFSDKGLALRVESNASAPAQIYSDQAKIRQILKNFLSNAAKFTQHGQVTITVKAGDQHYPLALAVRDTGLGIPTGKEEVIFEAFRQADGSTRRRYGGTGLGLSISKELAQLLGGQIRVTSTPGQGSCFTLYLPLSRDPSLFSAVEVIQAQEAASPAEVFAQSQRASATESAALGSYPGIDATDKLALPPSKVASSLARDYSDAWVLLVERDVQSLVAVTAALESLGLQVQTAADEEEALETLSEEHDCSMLLLACLDAKDTCDTITHLRRTAWLTELPIVVLGDLDSAAQGRCLEAGACCFLNKPIEPAALANLIHSSLQPEANPGINEDIEETA